jgi:hypothetical protein
MKSIPNKDLLSIKGDHSRTTTKDRKEGIVPHLYLKVGDQPVGNKG